MVHDIPIFLEIAGFWASLRLFGWVEAPFSEPGQVIARRAAPLLGWSWTMEAFHRTKSCPGRTESVKMGIEWVQDAYEQCSNPLLVDDYRGLYYPI